MSRTFFIFIAFVLIFVSCSEEDTSINIHTNNWDARIADNESFEQLPCNTTYLPVYSEIYSYTENQKKQLTVTVSMRNVNFTDTVFIQRIDFFDTNGDLIRTYTENPVYIRPMETIEIVIHEEDLEGGTGGNFIFEWSTPSSANDPLFEAVMISTAGQQGISFSTRGVKL